MVACARKKDMVNKNVLLIIETSFYLENCHFGCGYKQDVLQNETCYKTGRIRTRDFTVYTLYEEKLCMKLYLNVGCWSHHDIL